MSRLFDRIANEEVYIIAEMSANHGGNIDVALRIVREAARAGADCVKIQTYTADSLTIDCDNEYFKIKGGLWNGYKLYDLYSEAWTPYEWHQSIKDECERCGIDFLSTPFDKEAVDFLDSLQVEAFKIASFELNDVMLIEYAASKGKPMIMSCGMASIEDIQDAIEACHSANNNQIILLKCCSEYPANWEDMHLGTIVDMRERFNVSVGISDHSPGSLGPIVAATLGACVIEKHVKIDGVDSADSEFSMTIEEFEHMVQDVRNAKKIADGPDYTLSQKERQSTVFRRSLFAVENISAGDIITNDNVRSIRPGYGAAPKHLKAILGKKSLVNINKGEPITEEIIEGCLE